jgi:hypothetical protein
MWAISFRRHGFDIPEASRRGEAGVKEKAKLGCETHGFHIGRALASNNVQHT